MKAYSINKQHTMTQTSDCDASMHMNIDMKHMRDVDTNMHIAIHDAGIDVHRGHANHLGRVHIELRGRVPGA